MTIPITSVKRYERLTLQKKMQVAVGVGARGQVLLGLVGIYHGGAPPGALGHLMGRKRVAHGEWGIRYIVQDSLMGNEVWVVGSCFVTNFGSTGMCKSTCYQLYQKSDVNW